MVKRKNNLETFNFITHISITGFKECYQTKHIVVRTLWTFWLLFGFVMTLYFMSVIINDYRSNPTVTKVSERQPKRQDGVTAEILSDAQLKRGLNDSFLLCSGLLRC